MNETLNLTLSTNPSMILAVAGAVVFFTTFLMLSYLNSSVQGLSETIRRKDFKLKPQFDKDSGELVWEDRSAFTRWMW